MKKILLFALLLATGAVGRGQGTAAAKLDSSMVRFFLGKWEGKGAFGNGRPIAARVEFRLGLDSAWLVCEHRDELPNQYKADLYWGVDETTRKFVAYAFDNFHGHRVFASVGYPSAAKDTNEEERGKAAPTTFWDGKLLLQREAEAPSVGKYFERFVYERLSPDSFRMSYETSRDGVKWGLGDSLVFKRG